MLISQMPSRSSFATKKSWPYSSQREGAVVSEADSEQVVTRAGRRVGDGGQRQAACFDWRRNAFYKPSLARAGAGAAMAAAAAAAAAHRRVVGKGRVALKQGGAARLVLGRVGCQLDDGAAEDEALLGGGEA